MELPRYPTSYPRPSGPHVLGFAATFAVLVTVVGVAAAPFVLPAVTNFTPLEAFQKAVITVGVGYSCVLFALMR